MMCGVKGPRFFCVIQIKLNQLRLENAHMIINLTKKAYLNDITVTNLSQSFTYKMAAKTSWNRYGMSLSPYVYRCFVCKRKVYHAPRGV